MAETQPGADTPAPAAEGGPEIRYAGKWFALSVIIGVAAGLIAVGFLALLDLSEQWFTQGLADFHPPAPGGDAHSAEPPGLQAPSLVRITVVSAPRRVVSASMKSGSISRPPEQRSCSAQKPTVSVAPG